jgi:hypothetical protein
MYSAKKNNWVKRCKIIELQPKLLSKHSILTMVFQAPNRTIIVPSGARMDISEVIRHAVTSD